VNILNVLLENSEDAFSQQQDENQSLALELASVTALRDDLRREKESIAAQLKSNQAESASLSDRANELANEVQLKVESQLSLHMEHGVQVKELLGKLETSQNDASQSMSSTANLRSKLELAEALADKTNVEIQCLFDGRGRLAKQVR